MRLGDFWGAFNTESAPLLAMQFAARQFLLMALLEHHWSAASFHRKWSPSRCTLQIFRK
jgi:hypothetical protein